jgi:hypothetical protein
MQFSVEDFQKVATSLGVADGDWYVGPQRGGVVGEPYCLFRYQGFVFSVVDYRQSEGTYKQGLIEFNWTTPDYKTRVYNHWSGKQWEDADAEKVSKTIDRMLQGARKEYV